MKRIAIQLSVALAAVVLALGVGAVIIVAHGIDPIEAYDTLFSETLGDPRHLGDVLFKATTMIFTGIAAAFAFRSGMFNIGGEGQLYLGAFSCALAGLILPAGTPAFMALPFLLIAAFAGGALGATPPAILKATRGTHEVINTIMMNFILIAVVNYFVGRIHGPLPEQTPEIPACGQLPPLSAYFHSMRGSPCNVTLAVALAACAFGFYLFKRTRLGYELRAVGFSPRAAEYGGVSTPKMTLVSLLVSGGLAGLGGINFVMGSKGYFEKGFAPGQGFMGIAVALMARNHPLGVIPAAFLFALLSEGGLQIQQIRQVVPMEGGGQIEYFVPKEIGDILQAIVIVFVVAGMKISERIQAALEKRRAPHA